MQLEKRKEYIKFLTKVLNSIPDTTHFHFSQLLKFQNKSSRKEHIASNLISNFFSATKSTYEITHSVILHVISMK